MSGLCNLSTSALGRPTEQEQRIARIAAHLVVKGFKPSRVFT